MTGLVRGRVRASDSCGLAVSKYDASRMKDVIVGLGALAVFKVCLRFRV
jgi:hypothetical protein